MVDVVGNIIESAPKLSASADANGKLIGFYSSQGQYSYVNLKTDNNGVLVPNAKGVILKALQYDTYSNLYSLNFSANLNTVSNFTTSSTFLSLNKGDKKVINFYYGTGDTRVKQVF